MLSMSLQSAVPSSRSLRPICLAELIVVSFVVLAPLSSLADTVSGRIQDPAGKPVANATFVAKPAKGETVEFKTNASGTFSVYLDPGRYTISSSADPSLQGVIESYPQPVQQDVHLKKGN